MLWYDYHQIGDSYMPLILQSLVLPPECWDDMEKAEEFVEAVKSGLIQPYIPNFNFLKKKEEEKGRIVQVDWSFERHDEERKIEEEILARERSHIFTTEAARPTYCGRVDEGEYTDIFFQHDRRKEIYSLLPENDDPFDQLAQAKKIKYGV
jgi:hypothetical protein